MSTQTQQLLQWYDRARRVLPWREDPTPYHIWLSEIMLQQTRVEAGKGYYLRFIEALPDVQALAAAPEELCLKLWEGLGYYSRVRNLHRAAQIVAADYGGELPGTARELVRLPGIGPYSAAAIASIAFGEKVVSLDGNLLRIYSRLTEYEEDIRSAGAKKAAGAYYEERICAERPGDFNQALMDLGAGICLPGGEPLCPECPWEQYCAACRHHTQTRFPLRTAKKPRRREERTVLLLRRPDGRIALRRRPESGLLAGLYEFPNAGGQLDPEAAAGWVRSLNLEPGAVTALAGAKHIFTHIEWQMCGYLIEVKGSSPDAGLIWADRGELESVYSIPSAFEVYRNAALQAASPVYL